MAKLTVISTVYNGKQYLDEYFLSIASQTFKDYELILIDDGSTDGSGDICDENAKINTRIKVYHQNNQGVAAARNNAVSYACTEWVTFVDCDDAIHPNYLEFLYRGVIDNKVMISGIGIEETEVIPSFKNYDEMTLDWNYFDVNEKFLMGDVCSGYFGNIATGKLINILLLQMYPFTPGRIFEDNGVVKKWIYSANNVAIISVPLYFYRVNYLGLSKGPMTQKKAEDSLWARDEIISFYEEKGLIKAYNKATRDYILFGINLYFKLIHVDKAYAKLLKKQILKRYNKNKNSNLFSRSDKRFVFELKHPKLMWLYWKFKSLKG